MYSGRRECEIDGIFVLPIGYKNHKLESTLLSSHCQPLNNINIIRNQKSSKQPISRSRYNLSCIYLSGKRNENRECISPRRIANRPRGRQRRLAQRATGRTLCVYRYRTRASDRLPGKSARARGILSPIWI